MALRALGHRRPDIERVTFGFKLTDDERISILQLRERMENISESDVVSAALVFFNSRPRNIQIACLVEIRKLELQLGQTASLVRRPFACRLMDQVTRILYALAFANTSDSQIVCAAVHCLKNADDAELMMAHDLLSSICRS